MITYIITCDKKEAILTFVIMAGEKILAGALGFEPRCAGIKTLCLTAWLRPNVEFIMPSVNVSCQIMKVYLLIKAYLYK